METVVARKRTDGSTGYTAQIVIKRGGKTVHREARTFDRRPAATLWIAEREAELAKPGAIEALKTPAPSLGDAIDRYTAESRRAIGKTKTQVLHSMKRLTLCRQSELPQSPLGKGCHEVMDASRRDMDANSIIAAETCNRVS